MTKISFMENLLCFSLVLQTEILAYFLLILKLIVLREFYLHGFQIITL